MIKSYNSVYNENSWYGFLKAFFTPSLRPALKKCAKLIFFNFFLRQYHAVFFAGRIPVNKVDHPLDEKLPFVPSWITIYIDFVHYWLRMLSFFLRNYKRKAHIPVYDFFISMGKLYAYAARVYRLNLSTTKRPFYIGLPGFILIQIFDPHLMCIPSLHVMVAIHTYTMFANIAKVLGEEDKLKEQILEMKQGALAICHAILYIKQHSVNCIPASLYTMTCYRSDLFPPEEAREFTEQLFSCPPSSSLSFNRRIHPSAAPLTFIPDADKQEIKTHILNLYNLFMVKKETSQFWYDPLLEFLKGLPRQ